MDKILLFGGTGEGRALAEWMLAKRIPCTVCVATEYGETLLPAGAEAHVGRMDRDEMAALMAQGYALVVDATHPYADRVSENIRLAAETAGLPYYRLLRPREAAEGVLWADSPADAARMLTDLPGNVLLTTGSKDLKTFTQVPDYQTRLYVRVLPSLVSLSAALDLGYPAAHILCMQGPFPEKLNAALLEAVDAKILVTKDTGKAGGFPEKAAAAQSAGAKLLVIRRPTQETGYTLDALYDFLTKGRERL